ncbi:MAG: hypothetical protein LBF12_01485 [Christensenellaceae bacterium]|jgi:hypothetical protein|nr:hypothetical protein [Christensenellaceae bacterium]
MKNIKRLLVIVVIINMLVLTVFTLVGCANNNKSVDLKPVNDGKLVSPYVSTASETAPSLPDHKVNFTSDINEFPLEDVRFYFSIGSNYYDLGDNTNFPINAKVYFKNRINSIELIIHDIIDLADKKFTLNYSEPMLKDPFSIIPYDENHVTEMVRYYIFEHKEEIHVPSELFISEIGEISFNVDILDKSFHKYMIYEAHTTFYYIVTKDKVTIFDWRSSKFFQYVLYGILPTIYPLL